jgi:hypothetical protein
MFFLMDFDQTPAASAAAGAEAIRQLNHITFAPHAFNQPGDVSDVANGLASLVERLPQALQQASAGLRRLEEQQAIRMDDGKDVAEQVGVALRALLNAQEALTVAHGAMREAAGPLSHMGGLWVDDDEEADVR